MNLLDQYGNPRDLNEAEFQELYEQVCRKEELREKSLLGRWTDEQLRTAAAWVLLPIIIFVMMFYHHHDADRDAIPSQAWSFGEPGE